MADSIREALTSAISAAEAEEPAGISADPAPIGDAPAADATPIGEPKSTKEAITDAIDGPAPTELAAKPAETVAPVGTPDPQGPAAPATWKDEEKAAWAALPKAAQNAVLRREQDASRALNQAGVARKQMESYTKAVEPFEPLFKARGVEAPAAIREVMGMAAILITGSKEQKAHMLGRMIKDNGVDIEMLDAILAGEAPPMAPEAPPPAWAQPLLNLSRRLEETQREKADRLAAEATSAIEAATTDTANFPHFAEVSEDVADMLEVAAKRGYEMDLKQAYDRVVAMHPKFREIEQQKAKAAVMSVSDAARTLASARKAASTVSGAPMSAPSAKPSTLRDQLIAAMDG